MITAPQQRALDAPGHARDLALWVSVASRIVPALLRAARLRFLPRAGSHVEAELWFGPLVQIRGADSIVLYPDVAAALRAELGPERSALAKDVLRRVLPNRRRLVQLEEKLTWNALLPNGAGDADVDRTLRSIMRTIVAERSRTGLARWAAALRGRIPEIARFPAALQLEILARLSLQGTAATIDPGAFDALSAEDLALLRIAVPDAVDVGIRADTSSITITQPPGEDDDVVAVPASDPNVLFLRSGSGTGAASEMLALVRDRSASSPTGPLTASAVMAGGFPATLTTVTGRRYTIRSLSAAAASAWTTAAPFLVEILDMSEPAGTARIVGRGTLISPDVVVTASRIIDRPANALGQRKGRSLQLAVRFPGTGGSRVLATPLPRETNPPSARYGLAGLRLHGPLPVRPDVSTPVLEPGATVLLPGPGTTVSEIKWLAFAATPAEGYSVLRASRNTSAGSDAYVGAPAIHADGKHVSGVCIDADGELRCVTWSSLVAFLEQVPRVPEPDQPGSTSSSEPEWERTVFVAIPTGRKTIGDRVVDFDLVYRTVLAPAISAVRTADGEPLIALRADGGFYGGSMDDAMYRALELSRLVIADITGSNPNVMFELGIRLRARPSGMLIIQQTGSGVPFDIAHVRVFVYDPAQATVAGANITKIVAQAIGGGTVASPLRTYLTEHDTDGAAAALLSGAENATARGDFSDALAAMEQVLKRIKDPELHVRCAALANRIDQLDSALEHANAAIELAPDYEPAYRERGIAESRIGSDSAAEKSLEHAVDLDRTDADAWTILGGVYRRLGRVREAVDAFERASDLTDDPYVILTTFRLKALLGPFHLDERDHSRLAAVERYRLVQAESSPPIDTPWCFFDLSDVAYLEKRMDDFRRYLEVAVSYATPAEIRAHLEQLRSADEFADDSAISEAVRYLESLGSR